jgi:hypothetical protein
MLLRIITRPKPFVNTHMIRRFCHHGDTNFGKVMNKLNIIQTQTNFVAERITKLEKNVVNVVDMETLALYNFFFSVIVIPGAILFTR